MAEVDGDVSVVVVGETSIPDSDPSRGICGALLPVPATSFINVARIVSNDNDFWLSDF